MTLILMFLIAGIVIGYFDIISQKWINKLKMIPGISLLFILFLMGNKIGMDPKIFKNIDIIGFKALLIALGSIVGSMICIKIALGRTSTIEERQET